MMFLFLMFRKFYIFSKCIALKVLYYNNYCIKKFQDDEYETEASENFYVYYKKNGTCEAIEFFSPANVMLNGINLLDLPYKDIKNIFLKLMKT